MEAIGDIYVTWRVGKGRSRIPIGVIKRGEGEEVIFQYIKEEVTKAKDAGFTCYEGFPDLQTVYTKDVIEIFGQRIVNTERNDLSDFFSFWKINPKHKHDKFYMLAYTQGLLPIDNFEFLADFNPVPNLSFITDLAGLSSFNLPSNILSVGDNLRYAFEKSNKYDPNAVKVFKRDVCVGYIKTIHCNVFSKTKSILKVTVHHLEKNGHINRAFLHVSM